MHESSVSEILNYSDELTDGQLNAILLVCEVELMFRDEKYLEELERQEQEKYVTDEETA